MSTQNNSKNMVNSMKDSYHDYLQELYKKLEHDLNLLIMSNKEDDSLNHHPSTQQAKVQRNFINQKGEIFDNFRVGFEAHKRRVLLLGEAGIGKTISLLTHALESIDARLQDPEQALPIFVHIATWDSTNSESDKKFIECLSKYTDIKLDKEMLQAELKAGRCILFLDSLDGLSNEKRDETTLFDPRTRFISHIPHNNQFIITCRTADYDQLHTKLSHSETLELQALGDKQIEDYLQANTNSPQLWKIIQSNIDLLNIVRTPLILRLFVLAYYDNPNAINELNYLNQEQLRDMIIEHFIERRYQYTQQNSETAPFTLKTVYDMLGLIAKHNAMKYGLGLLATGKWDLVPLKDRTWGEFIIISELPFVFFGENTTKSDEFLNFVSQLQLIGRSKDSYCFSHALFRDFFVFKHCLPDKGFPDNHGIEALARIRDRRTIPIFANIVSQHLDIYIQTQALKALMSLPFSERLHVLVELFDKVSENEIINRIDSYFKKLINPQMDEAMKQWLQDAPEAATQTQHIWEKYI